MAIVFNLHLHLHFLTTDCPKHNRLLSLCTRNKHNHDCCIAVKTCHNISCGPLYSIKKNTYVAPATTNSTVFAVVEPDNVAMKTVVAMIIMHNLAVKPVRQLQIITGARRSIIIKGVIRIRASRAIDDFAGM